MTVGSSEGFALPAATDVAPPAQTGRQVGGVEQSAPPTPCRRPWRVEWHNGRPDGQWSYHASLADHDRAYRSAERFEAEWPGWEARIVNRDSGATEYLKDEQ